MVLKYDTSQVSLLLDESLCISCKLCLEVCPHAVLKMGQEKVQIMAKDRCIECGACAMNCPTNALKVQSGVGCAQAFINSFFNGGDVSCDCDSSSPTNKKANCC